MKKFEFKLETVHKVREIFQEKEAAILGKLQAEAEKVAQEVTRIEMMRQQAYQNYTERLTSGESLNINELELNSNHFTSLDRLQKEAETELQQKRRLCLEQIESVTGAMRKVKVTDRLRETQKDRHRLEFSRHEQNGIDELVAGTYARRLIDAK